MIGADEGLISGWKMNHYSKLCS